VKKLLRIAQKKSDQAEVYALNDVYNVVDFENSSLKNMESKMQSGVSLRILKDSMMGFAYTKNLLKRSELVRNALDSLKGKVKAAFRLPHTKDITGVNSYDPSINEVTNTALVDEGMRIAKILGRLTDAQINLVCSNAVRTIHLLNSVGTDITMNTSFYHVTITLLFPNSYAAIRRICTFKKFTHVPDSILHFVADLYNRSKDEVQPKHKKMKALFMPETMHVLMWRVQSATSGEEVYRGKSPLVEKRNNTVLSERLTIYNDPLDDSIPGARPVDDEGTPCRRFPIIEKGILKSFYYDLNYAEKMNAEPTGHGFRAAQWSSEPISLKPSPVLQHLRIDPAHQHLRTFSIQWTGVSL
jgi:PmbA protein